MWREPVPEYGRPSEKVTFSDEWEETSMDASVCETRMCAKTNGREQKSRQRGRSRRTKEPRRETEIKVKTDGKYMGIIMKAVKFLLWKSRWIRKNKNILISHQFYTAGGETPKPVIRDDKVWEDLSQLDVSCLAPFSYGTGTYPPPAVIDGKRKVSDTVVRC